MVDKQGFAGVELNASATKRQQEAPVHHRPTCHHGLRTATIDDSTVRSARWTVHIAPRRFISSLARYPELILGGLAVLEGSSIKCPVRVWARTCACWAVKERLTDAEKAAATHDTGPVASARRRAKPTG
jgi:hypothetical protein